MHSDLCSLVFCIQICYYWVSMDTCKLNGANRRSSSTCRCQLSTLDIFTNYYYSRDTYAAWSQMSASHSFYDRYVSRQNIKCIQPLINLLYLINALWNIIFHCGKPNDCLSFFSSFVSSSNYHNNIIINNHYSQSKLIWIPVGSYIKHNIADSPINKPSDKKMIVVKFIPKKQFMRMISV